MLVYTVEMLRYGEREAHSYVSGVYSSKELAICEAKLHILFRAGKYSAEIKEEIVDGFTSRIVAFIDEVWDTEEDIQNDIKSLKDWQKYRTKQLEKYASNRK
jgi:hypothetical protein